MTLNDVDKSGLIRESYAIEGITAPECRSIFLDWAIKLPAEIDPQQAIGVLLGVYASGAEDHPMTRVLRDGLGSTTRTGRRGGRKGRIAE